MWLVATVLDSADLGGLCPDCKALQSSCQMLFGGFWAYVGAHYGLTFAELYEWTVREREKVGSLKNSSGANSCP